MKGRRHIPDVDVAKGTLVIVLLDTGLRIGAVQRLRLKHLDFQNRAIRGLLTKGNRAKTQPLTKRACEALKIHIEANEVVDEVFGYHGSTLWRWVREVGAMAGIDNLHPHKLRHTFALRLLKRTHDIRLVSQALGHSSLAATQIYTERSEHELQLAIDDLAEPDKPPG